MGTGKYRAGEALFPRAFSCIRIEYKSDAETQSCFLLENGSAFCVQILKYEGKRVWRVEITSFSMKTK